jgi:hypothetical protein
MKQTLKVTSRNCIVINFLTTCDKMHKLTTQWNLLQISKGQVSLLLGSLF